MNSASELQPFKEYGENVKQVLGAIQSPPANLAAQHQLVKGLADENLGRALETVDRLRQQWSALPVWPLSVGFFVKVLATVVPPVAALLWHRFTAQLPL